MTCWRVVLMMLVPLGCGGPRGVAEPAAERDVQLVSVPPACNWKGRICYDSRASCLVEQQGPGLADPSACTERDEVACFQTSAGLPDTVCSPSISDCEIARSKAIFPTSNNVSPCYVVRYER